MYLTSIEKQSAVWLKLKKHMLERIDSLRCQNDGDHTPEETAKLRGRIAELRGLLAQGDAPEPATSGPTEHAGL